MYAENKQQPHSYIILMLPSHISFWQVSGLDFVFDLMVVFLHGSSTVCFLHIFVVFL